MVVLSRGAEAERGLMSATVAEGFDVVEQNAGNRTLRCSKGVRVCQGFQMRRISRPRAPSMEPGNVQFTSVRCGERLAELGAVPSIGSVGDSYDNALAETVNGLYKTELMRGPDQGPWRTIEEVELAILGWVH